MQKEESNTSKQNQSVRQKFKSNLLSGRSIELYIIHYTASPYVMLIILLSPTT
jgi:hypothetical protein